MSAAAAPALARRALQACLLVGAACAAVLAQACTTTVRPVQRRVIPAGAEREQPRDLVQVLGERLARDPANPRWYFELARVHEIRGELRRAEELVRQGARLVPADRYTGPHMVLGRLLVKQGRLDEALLELRRVLAVPAATDQQLVMNPDYREAHLLIGVILHLRGEREQARDAFRAFLGLGGDPARVVPYAPRLLAE